VEVELGVTVELGVLVGVTEGVGERVGDCVLDGLGVTVLDGEGEVVGEREPLGEPLGVRVGVLVLLMDCALAMYEELRRARARTRIMKLPLIKDALKWFIFAESQILPNILKRRQFASFLDS
jgi:hypothetical protein